jgi:DNase/tRNase domain of colicin-like bacteriocin
MDPFAGVERFPQSLHKYLYVHGDPINGTDPSGMVEGGLQGMLANLAIRLSQMAQRLRTVLRALDRGLNIAAGIVMGFNLVYTMLDPRMTISAIKVTSYNIQLIRNCIRGRRLNTTLLNKIELLLQMIARYSSAGDTTFVTETLMTGIPITIKANGFPDFTDWLFSERATSGRWMEDVLHQRAVKRSQLTFKYKGSRNKDFEYANRWAGITGARLPGFRPEKCPSPTYGRFAHNWSWHHHEVVGIFQLVLGAAHTPGNLAGLTHDGGVLFWKIGNGPTIKPPKPDGYTRGVDTGLFI